MHLPGEGKRLVTQGEGGRPVWRQGLGRRGVREEVVRQAGPGWGGLADLVRSVSLIPDGMSGHCEVIQEGEGRDLSYICNI